MAAKTSLSELIRVFWKLCRQVSPKLNSWDHTQVNKEKEKFVVLC